MPKRTWNGTDAVIGVDIDGVLGQYHEHFLRFARAWLGLGSGGGDPYWPGPMGYRDQGTCWEDDTYDGWCPLNEYMGVSKATYRKVKLAYRQGGLKRSMPAYPGARELLVGLRKRAWVVLCTTRPYLHLSNIEPDTVEFLRRNRLPYDDILMGEHKYRVLRMRYKERVAAVLDDDPALLSQARALSPPVPALFMLRGHNAHHWNNEKWWVNSSASALSTLVEHLQHGHWMLGIQPTNEEFGYGEV